MPRKYTKPKVVFTEASDWKTEYEHFREHYKLRLSGKLKNKRNYFRGHGKGGGCPSRVARAAKEYVYGIMLARNPELFFFPRSLTARVRATKFREGGLKSWKAFEMFVGRFFLGRRVPLSGRNSQHKTAADIMWVQDVIGNPCEWLYVECKRNAVIGKLIRMHYELLNMGQFGVMKNSEGENLYVFILEKFLDNCLDTTIARYCVDRLFILNIGTRWKVSASARIWEDAKVKCLKEGKRVPIVCLRLHYLQGIVAIADFDGLIMLQKWSKLLRTRAWDLLRLKKHFGILNSSDYLSEEQRTSNELIQVLRDWTQSLEEECPLAGSSRSSVLKALEKLPSPPSL